MILYCVRHGETVFNSGGRIQGQLDTPLSELGQRQCLAVTAAFRGQPIEAVYSSPLQRALGSAIRVADALGLEVRKDPRLMEINAGIFQGLTWDEIAVKYPEEAKRWKSQDPDFQIPGGESRRQLMARAKEAFLDIHSTELKQAIVVSHGGLLSAAFKSLLDIPAQRNPFSLLNGSISRLGWSSDVKLLSLNQTEHLQDAQGSGGDL